MEKNYLNMILMIIFSIISLVLANLTYFFPEQRLNLIGFLVLSLIFNVFLFYTKKIDSNKEDINQIIEDIKKLSGNLIEKFNYLKDLQDLKIEVEMLKKNKRGQSINLMDLIKILIAIIFLYAIYEITKSILAS